MFLALLSFHNNLLSFSVWLIFKRLYLNAVTVLGWGKGSIILWLLMIGRKGKTMSAISCCHLWATPKEKARFHCRENSMTSFMDDSQRIRPILITVIYWVSILVNLPFGNWFGSLYFITLIFSFQKTCVGPIQLNSRFQLIFTKVQWFVNLFRNKIFWH